MKSVELDNWVFIVQLVMLVIALHQNIKLTSVQSEDTLSGHLFHNKQILGSGYMTDDAGFDIKTEM